MKRGLVLGFLTGFIALSYEIVWFRVVSFASEGRADAFALLLGAYLVGIAVGAWLARRFCGEDPSRAFQSVTQLLAAGAAALFVGPLCARVIVWTGAFEATLPIVVVAALLLGAAFPLVTHAAVPADARVGSGLARIYLANVVGSTAGSLCTGMLAMDYLPLWQVTALLSCASLVIAGALLLVDRKRVARRAFAGRLAVYGLGLVAVVCSAEAVHDDLYARLQWKQEYAPESRFKALVENKSGVITVDAQDQIYGHGVYDGAFNVRLEQDTNGVVRAYALSGLHPAPKRMLMIGLSSGSWATVAANMPGLQHLRVIEINPGYLTLLPRFPQVAELTQHPNVKLEIDDGRRWMVRHPNERFDIIVANATFHWRASATNLLSIEFLQLVQARLAPGGIYFFNTTNSPRVQKTAAQVFPHVLRVFNFMVASDAPIHLDEARFRGALERWTLAGKPVFELTRAADRQTIERAIASLRPHLEDEVALRARTARFEAITDDNMGTEWEDRASHPSTSPFAAQVR